MAELSAKKTCFVTIGATAAFDALVSAVLAPRFLSVLQELGYTDLCVQHGRDEEGIYRKSVGAKVAGVSLNVTGFDFKKAGLRSDMVAAREGVVISHAGSGTILAALRLAVPLIVVPNTTLLNNHQEELAEEMEHQGYAIHGRLEFVQRPFLTKNPLTASSNLDNSLRRAERFRKVMSEWPPQRKGGDGRGLVGIMDDELGFVD